MKTNKQNNEDDQDRKYGQRSYQEVPYVYNDEC